MKRLSWGAAVLALAAACGGSGQTSSGLVDPPPPPPPPPPPVVEPPVVVGDFAYYGTAQGLTADVRDVSADEGGNVYVAGREALFVKKAGASDFVRVDAEKAGLTRNCWPEAEIDNPNPPGPPSVCPIISVAGAAAGKAIVGFQGVGRDDDYDAPWALDSGGMDVVTFDGTSVTRARHVLVASPPGTVCEHWANPPKNTVCGETWSDSPWMAGRKKMRQIQRIVVNHDASRPRSYGDVYMAGTHGALAILVAHPKERAWVDKTAGYPAFADAQYVWEHHHPAPASTNGQFLAGETWALAVHPGTNVPWYANQFRIASMPDYATLPHPVPENNWWGDQVPARPHLALWYGADPQDPNLRDNVQSLSFCDDGTLWVGSAGNGLARIAPDGSVSYVGLPLGLGDVALAVACDPTDGSVWVGFGWGGFGRYQGGKWWTVPWDAPAPAHGPARSIQIDRWSNPRAVLIAHTASKDGPGGVTIYTGK